ncbi:CDC7 [Cordylochernes scorpioides]|uniref:non-specific serine/threonine protein kinase n=1 Tax=Cordylochernes scorpioides TaxID=51811 RepID=A0ABY6K6S4_9ARAC|nr:CDC7 [Cordylochernes scorpioides]
MLDNIPEVKNHFDVIDKIGEGTFSKVFRARVKGDKQIREYALKYLIPTSHPSRIARELRCLKEVGGHFVIVMPHIPHERFSDIMQTMGHTEAKLYILNLLIALEKVHHHRIIHRDVKPSNFLYDRHQKSHVWLDVARKAEVAPRAGTPGFRAPEVLLKYKDQTTGELPPSMPSSTEGGQTPGLSISPSFNVFLY